MYRVPFRDLTRAIHAGRAEIDGVIGRVLDSGSFILGEELRAFESELATACGFEDVVGVASGTDAIEISLRTLGVGRGSEVITQANTCVPTIAAIGRAGATPVLCDVDRRTATMDPASLASALTARTRAVVTVHLYGQCGDMSAISEVARTAGIPLVEDCAQALGARSPGGPAGTHGELGAISFYPTKNLAALGDAGAIVTANAELAASARRLRSYGQDERKRSIEVGVNSRLDELQAAVLRARLPELDARNARRRAIAAHYDDALAGTQVTPLERLAGHHAVFHLYVVRAPRRGRFIEDLDRNGIQTMIHYPTPIHEHPAYRALAIVPTSLANTEALATEIVSLPLYPELTDAEVEQVATAARLAAGSN